MDSKVSQAVSHFKATNNKKNRNNDPILKVMLAGLDSDQFKAYMIATERINTIGSGRELVK